MHKTDPIKLKNLGTRRQEKNLQRAERSTAGATQTHCPKYKMPNTQFQIQNTYTVPMPNTQSLIQIQNGKYKYKEKKEGKRVES